MKRGYSLIEMLVVITLFAVMAVIITQIMIASLQGSKKSNSNSKVRTAVDYAVGIMERQLRGAVEVSCDPGNSTRVDYLDQDNNAGSFSLTNGAIASGSALLTPSDIVVSGLQFTCTDESVKVNATTGNVSVQTLIYLRNN